MKRGIILLLAVSAVVAAAEEPQAPVAPPPDAAAQAETLPDQPSNQQSETQRLLEQYRERMAEQRQRLPQLSPGLTVIAPNRTCYFIRMIRPVTPESNQQGARLVPLQSRVNAVQRGPDCSNGQLAPLTPTDRPDESRQSEPALTPVVAPAPSVPAADDR